MHGFGEGVEPLGPVERDNAIARLPLDQNRLFVHRRLFGRRFNPIAVSAKSAVRTAIGASPRRCVVPLRAPSHVRQAAFAGMRIAAPARLRPWTPGEAWQSGPSWLGGSAELQPAKGQRSLT